MITSLAFLIIGILALAAYAEPPYDEERQ